MKMRSLAPLLLVGLVPVLGACASTGGSTEQLASLQLRTVNAVDSALAANESMMRRAALNLGELGAEYAQKEFELELSLAKARRLESMQAPWAAPSDDLVATQKAVVLYHLYEVEMAEQRVLDARMAERRAAARHVLESYQGLSPLLHDAAEGIEVLLQHFNQPQSARIQQIANALLGEVAAFRTGLEASANPALQSLAADVARYEGFASRAKEQAAAALNGLMKPGGDNDG